MGFLLADVIPDISADTGQISNQRIFEDRRPKTVVSSLRRSFLVVFESTCLAEAKAQAGKKQINKSTKVKPSPQSVVLLLNS